jgi:hypothetical protein
LTPTERWKTEAGAAAAAYGGGHGVGADEMQRWPPFIAVYCVEAMWACTRMERGR